ncbi:MAG: hypothetical protein D6736_18700 [Nitrospinota bacterium]|nr:MAG: hypothetical protein D6736_18700 [Nitrospinota bacterium]
MGNTIHAAGRRKRWQSCWPIVLGLLLLVSLLPGGTSWAENGRRIVVFQPGTPETVQEQVVAESGSTILQQLPLLNAVVIQLPSGQEQAALALLQSHPEVQAIETDPTIQAEALSNGIQGLITPVDAAPFGYTWNLLQIGFDQVDPAIQGAGVQVAILDTGIDATHPELSPQVVGGYNARAGGMEGDFMDYNGHGTHVAGIIHTIAPQATLYAVRVLDEAGGGYLSDLINGLSWVYQQPAIRVVNMSLGFYQGSPLLQQIVQLLQQKGVVMVTSVGNYDCGIPASEGGDSIGATSEGGDSEGGDSEGGDGSGGDGAGPSCTWQVKYPARYPETIGVGATDSTANITTYSVEGVEVDVVAPGGTREVPVLSTYPGGGYGVGSGTSQAAAHVSGLVALLLGVNPSLTPDDIRMVLQDTALDLGVTGTLQGAGLIDAAFATQLAPLVCFGQYATMMGTEGDDILSGTPGTDVIVGLGGNDIIQGKDGNDLLCGGAGDDSIEAGYGDDFLDGGPGDDLLDGQGGNDVLIAGAGNDALDGGYGNDVLVGGEGNNLLSGGDGSDILQGGPDQDIMQGGYGDDLLDGGAGDDFLDGQGGNDMLQGGTGYDVLSGGYGNDILDGGEGNDQLSGQGGDDVMVGGAGNDMLDGGYGYDFLDGGEGVDLLNGGGGIDTCLNGESLSKCEP